MPQNDRELIVQLAGTDVGLLRLRGDVTSFIFLDSYLEQVRRPVLGQTFEEAPRKTWRQATKLPVWFSNLLPEDPMRRVVADGLGINPENEFRLLEALASDLPGALSLRDASEADYSVRGPRPETEGLDASDSGPLVRFSLAGVQLKLSMIWSSNTLTLPGTDKFGDRLVKFPSARYAGVPENEYSMMRWAEAAGLDTPRVELRKASEVGPIPEAFKRLATSVVYVVDRFDRDGTRRIHMEDMNQVFGNWPQEKYDNSGHERLGLVIRALCGDEAFEEYVRRLVFCIGIGNEDAHLKNWSLLYPDGVTPTLSPVYDLVSTVQYDDLDRGLALRLNDTRDMQVIDRRSFERLARKVGVPAKTVLDVVDETIERMRHAWREIESELPVDVQFRERLRSHQRSVPVVSALAA